MVVLSCWDLSGVSIRWEELALSSHPTSVLIIPADKKWEPQCKCWSCFWKLEYVDSINQKCRGMLILDICWLLEITFAWVLTRSCINITFKTSININTWLSLLWSTETGVTSLLVPKVMQYWTSMAFNVIPLVQITRTSVSTFHKQFRISNDFWPHFCLRIKVG